MCGPGTPPSSTALLNCESVLHPFRKLVSGATWCASYCGPTLIVPSWITSGTVLPLRSMSAIFSLKFVAEPPIGTSLTVTPGCFLWNSVLSSVNQVLAYAVVLNSWVEVYAMDTVAGPCSGPVAPWEPHSARTGLDEVACAGPAANAGNSMNRRMADPPIVDHFERRPILSPPSLAPRGRS